MRVIILIVMITLAEGFTAAGSSLLCPVMKACLQSYNDMMQGSSPITYDCIGSGAGKRLLLSNESALAGTDSLFHDEAYMTHPDLQMIPVVAAPIAITFNLLNYKTITLDRQTLSRIFLGDITNWSHPHITRLNPSIMLPDETIHVVVRDDNSGTTEIMTKAFKSFGYWSGDVTTKWPVQSGIERRLKSSGVLNYVTETPFSLGYSGISGVLKEGLPFVTLINRVDAYTIPGWDDGEIATTSLSLDPKRLTGDLVDSTGYPIAGLSYLSFFATPGANDICEIVSFIVWMITSPVSRAIIRASNFVPLDNKIVNQILDKLAIDCNTNRLETKISIHTGTQNEFDSITNDIGYKYYQETITAYVNISFVDDVNVMIRAESDPLPTTHVDDFIKIDFASGILTVTSNFGIPVPSMELDLEVIAELFTGRIRFWNDSRLSARSSYVPNQNIPVQVVAHKSLVLYHRMMNQLANHFTSLRHIPVRLPDVILDSHLDVAEYVKKNVGCIAVVDFLMADQWKLPLVYPAVNGVPVTPSLSVLTSGDSIYPFIYKTVMFVRKNVASTGCFKAHALFAKWALQPRKITESLRKHMMFPIANNNTDEIFSTLRCNGNLIFPEEGSSDDQVWMIVGIVSGVVVSLVACLLGAFIRNWRKEKQRYDNAFGAQVLAAEMAEAITVLDFHSLERVLTIENPDRIQSAIRDITIMMKEFVKYIPQSVIKAARNEEDSCQETVITDTTNTKQPSQTSSTGAGSGTLAAGRLGLGRRLDKAVRNVSVLVVRRLFTKPDSNSPEKSLERMHTEFLTVCLHEIEKTYGTTHRVSEDSVVGTWGSMTDVRRADVKRICQVATSITNQMSNASCGVQSGLACCGSLGNDKIKTFHIMGGLIEEADNLCRLAQASRARCILPHSKCIDLWGHCFKFCRFFNVASIVEGKLIETAVLLCETLARLHSKEWMYELDDAARRQEPGPESAMSELINSNSFELARSQLKQYTPQSSDENGPFVEWLETTLDIFADLYPGTSAPAIPVLEVSGVGTILTTTGAILSRMEAFGPSVC